MENINEAIESVFNIVSAIKNARSEDSAGGKTITLSEKISIGVKGLSLVKIVTHFDAIKIEWQNRNDEGKQELIEMFKSKFDLADDELEFAIENLVESLISFETSFNNFFTK